MKKLKLFEYVRKYIILLTVYHLIINDGYIFFDNFLGTFVHRHHPIRRSCFYQPPASKSLKLMAQIIEGDNQTNRNIKQKESYALLENNNIPVFFSFFLEIPLPPDTLSSWRPLDVCSQKLSISLYLHSNGQTNINKYIVFIGI